MTVAESNAISLGSVMSSEDSSPAVVTGIGFPVRVGMTILFLVFGVFGAWAPLAPLDSAAYAPGLW